MAVIVSDLAYRPVERLQTPIQARRIVYRSPNYIRGLRSEYPDRQTLLDLGRRSLHCQGLFDYSDGAVAPSLLLFSRFAEQAGRFSQ
jgi:hypothetical protein